MAGRSCPRCLLTSEVPGVTVPDQGPCSVCASYDRASGQWATVKEERPAALERSLEKARRKNRIYDVLVPLSGGKDSTYVLYLCRERFGLKCLAVTFDNGFLADHARENIRKACGILGVDHVYFSIHKSVMMRLYRYAFLETGYFCPICLSGMGAGIFRIQKAFGVPLCVKGTSPRTEEHVSREFFVSSNDFTENLLIGSPVEKDARLLLEPGGWFKSPPAIQLPQYWDWNYAEIFATITDKLGWKAHRPQAEHTDCMVDNVVNWIRYRRYPALVPEMTRFSKLVTIGQMSREEAERRVAEERARLGEPSNLEAFLSELSITREEYEKAVANPLKHFPYLKPRSRVRRRLRALARRAGLGKT